MCLLNFLRKSKKKSNKEINIDDGFDAHSEAVINSNAASTPRLDKLDYRAACEYLLLYHERYIPLCLNVAQCISLFRGIISYCMSTEHGLNIIDSIVGICTALIRAGPGTKNLTCSAFSGSMAKLGMDCGVGSIRTRTTRAVRVILVLGRRHSVNDAKQDTKRVGNFIVKSHCDSDSDESISHYGDAETDNWHGIDLTRRGRTAKKKSSLQEKLNKRNNSLQNKTKRQISSESNQGGGRIMVPTSRKGSLGCRSPSVRSGASGRSEEYTQIVKRSQHSSCKSVKSVTTSDASEFRRSMKQRSRRPSMLTALPFDSINPNLYT